MNLILASRSPRRAELLRSAGLEFTVRVADVDETPYGSEDPTGYVLRIAEEKGRAVFAKADEIVLSADTIVAFPGSRKIMGKPKDAINAARMLRALSGRRHDVITGVCIRRGTEIAVDSAATAVWFAELTDREIIQYVASGEPMDKAGAYGIQGLASKFIDRIDGSYTNVVGLPVALVYRMLGSGS